MMYFDWFSCRLRADKTPSDPSVLPFGIKTRTCVIGNFVSSKIGKVKST